MDEVRVFEGGPEGFIPGLRQHRVWYPRSASRLQRSIDERWQARRFVYRLEDR